MSFRKTTLSDAEQLWRWRRESEREGRTQGWWKGELTTWEQHRDWFESRLRCPLVDVLVWEEHGYPKGMARIDSNGEFVFYVPELYRGDGVEIRLLKAAKGLGRKLKVTADFGNQGLWGALERAGFTEYPVKFLCWHPTLGEQMGVAFKSGTESAVKRPAAMRLEAGESIRPISHMLELDGKTVYESWKRISRESRRGVLPLADWWRRMKAYLAWLGSV